MMPAPADPQIECRAQRLAARIKALAIARCSVPANPGLACQWPSWIFDINSDWWMENARMMLSNVQRSHVKKKKASVLKVHILSIFKMFVHKKIMLFKQALKQIPFHNFGHDVTKIQ